MLQMPLRTDRDGEIVVTREPNGDIAMEAVTDKDRYVLICTEYNAWRIFGSLSLMLGIPLPSKTAKAIKLGNVSVFRGE